MSIYKGQVSIAGLAKNTIITGFNIFDVKWSDHILNDIQWLRADTFSWQDGNVYKTAYDKLVEEYATGVSEEEEDEIIFKRSTNGFKIALPSQEANILAKYNSDGIAWYYILDTTNKRFKLPRTKFGFEGLRGNVGDDIAESLPNIKGTTSLGTWRNSQFESAGLVRYASGCMGYSKFFTAGGNSTSGFDTNTNTADSIDFDASRSSSTYQDNAPVQERATQMYLYFYVGEYSREATEQTAGITSEQLNKKLDNEGLMDCEVVIETYVDGTSGYRIWSDGYCEQWGVGSYGASSCSVTLAKTYKDTTYNIVVAFINNSTSYSTGGTTGLLISKKSGSLLYFDQPSNSSRAVSWKTSGYLAEGEY